MTLIIIYDLEWPLDLFPGITQEEIDETRLIPEKNMLKDMQYIVDRHGNLEYLNEDHTTPVSISEKLVTWTNSKYENKSEHFKDPITNKHHPYYQKLEHFW